MQCDGEAEDIGQTFRSRASMVNVFAVVNVVGFAYNDYACCW